VSTFSLLEVNVIVVLQDGQLSAFPDALSLTPAENLAVYMCNFPCSYLTINTRFVHPAPEAVSNR
jgi:hypothetical protein